MHDELNGSDAVDGMASPLAAARRASGTSAAMVDCRRRALVASMAQGLITAPVGVLAQPAGKVYRIGYLSPGAASQGVSSSFLDTLKELGYSEGRNLVIESRFADAKWDDLPSLAKDLVRAGVDVIVTIGTPTVQAAKDATATIPIVMAGSADPVEHKLVASLARPGGNVTGVTHSPGPEISGKGLQLLKEAVPALSRVAILWTRVPFTRGFLWTRSARWRQPSTCSCWRSM